MSIRVNRTERALGLQGERSRSARAQNLKLVHIVDLVLQSEGRYS